MDCPICESTLNQKSPEWLYSCPCCGFESSTLHFEAARIVGEDEHLDEGVRETALRTLRQRNFRTLLDKAFDGVELAGLSLLEVGCGHGWFLDEAKMRGLVTLGIEPDTKIVRRSANHGDGHVRAGFFPQALGSEERFDIIIFNDVFEHLPDIKGALYAIDRHLKPDGFLVLNMPSRNGVFYRLARFLTAFSIWGPFERMWQKGMPSPHLSYFTSDNARQLCAKHDLSEERCFSLPSLRFGQLWQRLRLSRSNPVIVDVAIWGGCALLIPFLRLLPADITVQSFRRPSRTIGPVASG